MSKPNDNKELCPHCGVNLQVPIPEELQHHYNGATHGSRKIGISSMELDRVTKWQCPDCKGEWERE